MAASLKSDEVARFSRRSFVNLALGAALLTSFGPAATARARGDDIADLKRFVQRTIGKTPAKRKALAKETLAGINPLKGGEMLELAALGVLARESSTREIVSEGLPQRSKDLLDSTLSARAGQGWAHAMAGAWHFEVVRRSGLVATLLGADRATGNAQFKKARKSEPGDPGIYLLEAISLIYDGRESNRQRIVDLLNKALAKSKGAAGGYEKAVSKHARSLAKKAKGADMSALEKAVRAIY